MTENYDFPATVVVVNNTTNPFTFTVYRTDEQFTLQAGESVTFEIKSYGEMAYYQLNLNGMEFITDGSYEGATTYNFIEGQCAVMNTPFVPYRESFAYPISEGDVVIMPTDTMGVGAYYSNLTNSVIAPSITSGVEWTPNGAVSADFFCVLTGTKEEDGHTIQQYKVYGTIPYMQADANFDAGNRAFVSMAGAAVVREVTVTENGTSATYSNKDFLIEGYAPVTVPQGIVSVEAQALLLSTYYFEFDFTEVTLAPAVEGNGTLTVACTIGQDGADAPSLSFTVQPENTDGYTVYAKVFADEASVPTLAYRQVISGYEEPIDMMDSFEMPVGTTEIDQYIQVVYTNENGECEWVGVANIQAQTYHAEGTLTGCTSMPDLNRLVMIRYGQENWTATITPDEGLTINTCEVEMGGTDITSSVVTDGENGTKIITIPVVTGDVTITATAE